MIACADCRATNAAGLAACARCGASLDVLRGGERAEEVELDLARRDLEGKARIRRLRRLHAFVGATTFFLLQLLVGLPDSLLPSNLIVNAVVSAALGAPIGYLISRWRAGPMKGALISGGVFVAVRLLIGLVSGESGTFIWAVAWGFAGALPGFFIGFHVSTDE